MFLSTYMRRTHLSENTVRSALQRLCELGYLKLEKRGGNRPGDGGVPAANHYCLNRELPLLAPIPDRW